MPFFPSRIDPATAAHRAHLIGVAGAGMRSLAHVLQSWGWQLSGSDLATDSVQFLAESGIRLFHGHSPEHVPDHADLVVYSDAIPADNPERRRAAALGIPTLSYFEVLGRIMAKRRGLAVAGTHGKSTTTAMAADLLVAAGLDPTVVFGATPIGQSSGGRAGGGDLMGDLMLVEACEYRENFLHLWPEQAVILGIEPDHFDYYRLAGQLEQAFAAFAGLVPPNGLLLVRGDCPVSRWIATGRQCRVETFALDQAADWSAQAIRSQEGRYAFQIRYHGRYLCDVQLQVPGQHNVLNALAAGALAFHNDVPGGVISRGLGAFRGLKRRLEPIGTVGGVTLLDDYAHHPTEVAASLETVRQMYPGRRVGCVFQPHQASRTQVLLDELAASLHNADWAIVAEIYRAREGEFCPGEITAADLAEKVRSSGVPVPEVFSADAILDSLNRQLRPGDVLITMGAGDIGKICHAFIDRFREDRAAG